MAKDKKPSESLTGICFNWLQNTMSASPWGNADLNKKFVSYTTENVSAAFGFVQKLSRAKNLEDVAKMQTEFMTAQWSSFNEQAKNIGEIYTRTAAAMRMPFGLST